MKMLYIKRQRASLTPWNRTILECVDEKLHSWIRSQLDICLIIIGKGGWVLVSDLPHTAGPGHHPWF